MLQKKKQLFSLGSNNSLLEFIVEGTPQVKEYFLDSKKEVDKQLKLTCEHFISHCTLILIGPLKNFITKVNRKSLLESNLCMLSGLTHFSFSNLSHCFVPLKSVSS